MTVPEPTEPRGTAKLRRTAKLHKTAVATTVSLIATVLAVVIGSGSATASLAEINTNNRSEVARTYLAAVDAASQVPHGWSGSVDGCQAGDVSPAFQSAMLGSINWFRHMAGLDSIVENHQASARAQQAALMMHAQNSLSHNPSQPWACFSDSGAESAGRANLTLGVVGVDGVSGQIEDPGAGNTALGHRRWLLYPPLSEVGVGSTSRAGAVEVIGDFSGGKSASPWIAWPPEGYVPTEVVFPRWSISRDGADFSQARVSMTRNGQSIPVDLLPRANGFGLPTLGWEVRDLPSNTRDTSYTVSVSNVLIDGSTTSLSYEVTAFDPLSAPDVPTCQGRPATIVGTAGDDIIRGTDGDDVIVGLGGNDQISGLDGNDVICGNSGRDIIEGNAGRDLLHGNSGRDTVIGGKGEDQLLGGKGKDALIGGLGTDQLAGGGGNDRCWGGQKNATTAHPDTRSACESGS